MNNTAETIDRETVATLEHNISNELIAVILERETYAEKNPDCWIPCDKALEELDKI